jgi:3-oxoacyl-[acyl-carrier-protein] synthase-3
MLLTVGAESTRSTSVFITSLGVCLPNQPVANDRIEEVLGMLDGRPSRLKPIILRRNGIRTRYYARDPERGATHTNAQMTVEAIRSAADRAGFDIDRIDLLACGTASPDQMIPSHASMVHGLLGCPPCELIATTGVCCAGMTALKHAYLSVLTSHARGAMATGSELASSWLQANAFQSNRGGASTTGDSGRDLGQEFLRWMLSDGAGALLLENRPRAGSVSLRIDWLDILSYANELETCMYAGGLKRADGTLFTWRQLETFDRAWEEGYLNLTQDVKLLDRNIIQVGSRSLQEIRNRHDLAAERIDWFLPHISSESFRRPIRAMLAESGFELPQSKWYTNLVTKGNTGSASIYIMLEELWSSGRLKKNDRILCIVPESARFTYAFMHLTAV